RTHLFVRGFHVAIDVEGAIVPLGVVVDHVLEELGAEAELGARLPALLTDDPGTPSRGIRFTAGRETGEHHVTLAVEGSAINLLQRGELGRGEAGIRVGALTAQALEIDRAGRGTFD